MDDSTTSSSLAKEECVRFADARSVYYWQIVFGCTELQLREAAAQLKTTSIAALRDYFNWPRQTTPLPKLS